MFGEMNIARGGNKDFGGNIQLMQEVGHWRVNLKTTGADQQNILASLGFVDKQ